MLKERQSKEEKEKKNEEQSEGGKENPYLLQKHRWEPHAPLFLPRKTQCIGGRLSPCLSWPKTGRKQRIWRKKSEQSRPFRRSAGGSSQSDDNIEREGG